MVFRHKSVAKLGNIYPQNFMHLDFCAVLTCKITVFVKFAFRYLCVTEVRIIPVNSVPLLLNKPDAGRIEHNPFTLKSSTRLLIRFTDSGINDGLSVFNTASRKFQFWIPF